MKGKGRLTCTAHETSVSTVTLEVGRDAKLTYVISQGPKHFILTLRMQLETGAVESYGSVKDRATAVLRSMYRFSSHQVGFSLKQNAGFSVKTVKK